VLCIVILESLEMLRAFCTVRHVETLLVMLRVLCICTLAALSMLGELPNSSSSASDVDRLLCVAELLHCLSSDGGGESDQFCTINMLAESLPSDVVHMVLGKPHCAQASGETCCMPC
jgi:hypothetical protein